MTCRPDLAKANSDLAFYRSLAGEKAGEGNVLKVQQLRVVRGPEASQYLLRLVLGRPMNREDAINGRIRMTFEGTTAATPVNLDLAAVSQVEGGELSFNYRYSQTIEIPIQLPAGFRPARTAIELTPSRKGVNPVRTSVGVDCGELSACFAEARNQPCTDRFAGQRQHAHPGRCAVQLAGCIWTAAWPAMCRLPRRRPPAWSSANRLS